MKNSIRNDKCAELKSRIAKKQAKLDKLYGKLKGAEESQQHKAIDRLEYFQIVWASDLLLLRLH